MPKEFDYSDRNGKKKQGRRTFGSHSIAAFINCHKGDEMKYRFCWEDSIQQGGRLTKLPLEMPFMIYL